MTRKAALILIFSLLFLAGCGKEEFVRTSEILITDKAQAAEKAEVRRNPCSALDIPTQVNKIGDTWFIVDCYHDQIIYNDNMEDPLTEWNVMTDEMSRGHTVAGDGLVYLVDDTENDRIMVFEKVNDKFLFTQQFSGVGSRPHYVIYDEDSRLFYAWCSMSGEMYIFSHKKDDPEMYLKEIRSIPELDKVYVRSFTIIDGDIYFVSGVSGNGTAPQILRCDLATLKVKKSYPVPDSLAGMIQITPIDDMFYITVSTDINGNQDYATIIRTASLEDLAVGEYEDIYSQYFIGGGTPYNLSKVDDSYFLTEHRLQGHSIWRFKVEDGDIVDVESLY